MNVEQFAGWAPIRVYWDAGRPMVDWCYMGDARFVEPFFSETTERRLQQPFALLFRRQTPIETLLELQERQPGLPPSGFIFHLSRCGSTLVSQMLAALPRNIVLSEPAPIDAVLRANSRDSRVTDEQRIAWLRGVVSALGRPRDGRESQLFIKFDAWHVLELPLIARAFPGVPWIFLYRDPVEVIASHQREIGSQMVPGALPASLFGLDLATAVGMPPDEYHAHVLACLCRAGLAYATGPGRLVEYRQLPEAALTVIPDHFGLQCSDEDRGRMRAAARFDAKQPTLRFTDDTQAKQRAVSAATRAVIERLALPLYDALEAERQREERPAASLVGAGRSGPWEASRHG